MKENLRQLFRDDFKSFLFLSLITAGLSLGVVTLVPAFVALEGTFIKILDDSCDYNRFHEYWHLFKKKFKNAFFLELIMAAYAAMLMFTHSLADKLPEKGTTLLVIIGIFGLLAAMVSVGCGMIIAGTETPLGDALWNGFILAVGRFPRVFAAVLWIYGTAIIAFLLYPISLVVLAALGVSNAAAMAVCFMWKPLDELVLNPDQYE